MTPRIFLTDNFVTCKITVFNMKGDSSASYPTRTISFKYIHAH